MRTLAFIFSIIWSCSFAAKGQSLDSLIVKHPILKPLLALETDSTATFAISLKENSAGVMKEPAYQISYSLEDTLNVVDMVKPSDWQKLRYHVFKPETSNSIDSLFTNNLLENYDFDGNCEWPNMVKGYCIILKKGDKLYYYLHRDCKVDFNEGGDGGRRLLELLFLIGVPG